MQYVNKVLILIKQFQYISSSYNVMCLLRGIRTLALH